MLAATARITPPQRDGGAHVGSRERSRAICAQGGGACSAPPWSAVPLFRRLGLGSVLGYLAAGLAIGPFGLALFTDPQAILHVAELGVVMFLFVVGLEMQPSRLWGMRRQIFGLGSLQVLVCGALLTGVGVLGGLPLPVAFIAAMGFVLTSTAIVMQILEERGVTATPRGAAHRRHPAARRPGHRAAAGDRRPARAGRRARRRRHALGRDRRSPSARWRRSIVAGIWLLNPLFRAARRARARARS